MITSGYLILIAALSIAAGLLLYARFASRSRENSSLEASRIRIGGPEEKIEEVIVRSKEGIVEAPTKVAEPVEHEPSIEVRKRSDESVSAEKNEKKHVAEREYLDDLQEAAAGLAMLMRSSPVSERPRPVVFAPDEDEIEAIEFVEDPLESEPETLSEEIAVVEEEETIIGEPEFAVSEEETAEVETKVEPEPEVRTLEQIVGEEVHAKIVSIDGELDELEDLVASIEASFSALELDGEAPADEAQEDLEKAA